MRDGYIEAGGGARRLFRGFGLGLFIAIVGLIAAGLPFGSEWEEDIGLTWLFRLRGPVAPPEEVAVVSIDRESSKRLGLPDNPRKWSRELHARLLERLTELKASVAVFDVQFQEPRDPAGDRAFAEAVRRAGNVILFEFLKKDTLPIPMGNAGGTSEVVIEQRIPPIATLADGALGLAPFALPRVPRKVAEVWIFKPDAGGAATLPMVALQAHRPESQNRLLALIRDLDQAAYRQLIQAGVESGHRKRIDERAEVLRQIFLVDPSLATRLQERLDMATGNGIPPDRHLSALIAALAGPSSIHLNYYGPPRTIDTFSYHQVLTGAPLLESDMAGRTLFIGAAPRMQPEQRDGFYTPFTLHSGLDIGGAEIAATAFANLLDQNSIQPLKPLWEGVLLLLWGLSLGVVLRRFGGGWIPLAATTVGGSYFAVAYLLFVRGNLWLPLVIPLLAQLVPATFGAILLRYRDLQRERENIRRAFGLHLPLPVVDQLARGIDDFKGTTTHAYGVCLATDAHEYTSLSELLAPGELKDLMNRYYEALFAPVRSRGGVIADVVGDSMLAIWATDIKRPELRQEACKAALEILSAVDDFNRSSAEHQLPTRLGLHCGELVLGHVGAVDHFEYRAIGDIVNTASRVEALGKRLGTRLLVSDEVVRDLDGLQIRPLGRFLLKGKTRPLGICELMSPKGSDDRPHDGVCERFSEGLDAFQEGDLKRALEFFEAIEHELGNDGPTAFYRHLCRRHLAEPLVSEWTGIVRITEK